MFERIVRLDQGDRHARGLRRSNQFDVTLLCQFGRAQSLREIYEGLQASEGEWCISTSPKPPLISTAPERSTGSVPRPVEPCPRQTAHPREAPLRGLRQSIHSSDSTVIDLCAKVFNCAKFRTATDASKIYTLLDHDGLLPEHAVTTQGKAADIKVVRKLLLCALQQNLKI